MRIVCLAAALWAVPLLGFGASVEVRLGVTLPGTQGASSKIRVTALFDTDLVRTQPGAGELALFDPRVAAFELPDGVLASDTFAGTIGIGNDFMGEFPPGDGRAADAIVLALRLGPNPLNAQLDFSFEVADPTTTAFDTVNPLALTDAQIGSLIAHGEVRVRTGSRSFLGDQVTVDELSFRRVGVPEPPMLGLLLLSAAALVGRLRARFVK